jgi:predicted nucleic acid-binding protein
VSAFLDTNILVYAQQTGDKAEISQNLIAKGGKISAQVLNELANVLRKKHDKNWDDIERVLEDIDNALDPALPLTSNTNKTALTLAREHRLSFYDALIVASAMESDCDTLFSEDLQHGPRFGRLVVINPFLESTR